MPGRPCERRSTPGLDVAHDATTRPGARPRVTSGSGDDAGRWNDPRAQSRHVLGIGSATGERTDERSPPLSYSPSLDNDTVDQQQPAMNSQTDLRAGHEDLRLIGVSFDTPHPTQRSSLHQRPVSPTSRPSTPGGGSSAVLVCGGTPERTPSPSSSRPNGPGSSSPPDRTSHPHDGYRTMLRLPLWHDGAELKRGLGAALGE